MAEWKDYFVTEGAAAMNVLRLRKAMRQGQLHAPVLYEEGSKRGRYEEVEQARALDMAVWTDLVPRVNGILPGVTYRWEQWTLVPMPWYLHPATVGLAAELLGIEAAELRAWSRGLRILEAGELVRCDMFYGRSGPYEVGAQVLARLRAPEVLARVEQMGFQPEDFIWEHVPVPPAKGFPYLGGKDGSPLASLHYQLLQEWMHRRPRQEQASESAFWASLCMQALERWILLHASADGATMWELIASNHADYLPFELPEGYQANWHGTHVARMPRALVTGVEVDSLEEYQVLWLDNGLLAERDRNRLRLRRPDGIGVIAEIVLPEDAGAMVCQRGNLLFFEDAFGEGLLTWDGAQREWAVPAQSPKHTYKLEGGGHDEVQIGRFPDGLAWRPWGAGDRPRALAMDGAMEYALVFEEDNGLVVHLDTGAIVLEGTRLKSQKAGSCYLDTDGNLGTYPATATEDFAWWEEYDWPEEDAQAWPSTGSTGPAVGLAWWGEDWLLVLESGVYWRGKLVLACLAPFTHVALGSASRLLYLSHAELAVVVDMAVPGAPRLLSRLFRHREM